MPRFSWLRNLFSRKSPTARGSLSRKRKSCPPPTLEFLEDRTLPNGTPLATLQLWPSSSQDTEGVAIALDSFRFGFHNTSPIDSNNGSSGKAAFDSLDVTASYNANSPTLLAGLTGGVTYGKAVLTQRDAGGHPVAAWAMGTVLVSDDSVTKNTTGLPEEELKFFFGSVREATSATNRPWSQLTNSDTDVDGEVPEVPADLSLSALPAQAGSHLTATGWR
jgi:hypothetical protein